MQQLPLLLVILLAMVAGTVAQCDGVMDGIFVDNPDGDCQDYFVCMNGTAFDRRCPTGFFFDQVRQMCYYWDEVLCGYPTDPCYGMPQYWFVARPSGTCSSYYRCEYGQGVPLDCPDGFFFDEPNQMCNFPDQVNCDDFAPPTPPTPPSTTPAPTTTVSEMPTAPTPVPTNPSG